MKIDLPARVLALIGELEGAGYHAYLVGGALRDQLSGIPAQDFDLATDAAPDEMRRVFENRRILDHGEKHGTLCVFSEGAPVEITTFRTESAYSDARHPDEVAFTRSLEADLARRDFTVNAMAYSKRTGLIDPYGGKADLKRKRLRCVGDPDRRFSEDALRILRALRFCAVRGFSVEERTKRAIFDHVDALEHLARERVFSELEQTLCGKEICRVLIEFAPVFCALIPELFASVGFEQHSPYHCYPVYTHIARTVGEVRATPELRFAALFHDVAKPACFRPDATGRGHFPGHAERGAQIAKQALSSLRAPRALIDRVGDLVRDHDEKFKPDLISARRAIARYGKEYLLELLELERADALAHEPKSALEKRARLAAFIACIEEVCENGDCVSLKDLAINGEDLLSLSVPSEQIGRLLERALDAVIEGRANNRKEELLAYLERDLKTGEDL